MALYAFDGTAREDDVDNARDTNVVRFARAYRGRRVYYSGVGTRFGSPGKLIGGWTGTGTLTRVNEALKALNTNLAHGDTDIDIVGFSRGAAAARDFANEARREVRFLGLFDTVASTGILPGPIDLGLNLDVPATVRRCSHAMALDEGRATFHLHRAQRAPVAPIAPEEVWFRGSHSDIGGGFEHDKLANITLVWMMRRAVESGLRFDEEEVMAAVRGRDRAAGITRAPFDKGAKRRQVKAGDLVHCSVRTRAQMDDLWYVNPPAGCPVVDDEMRRIGTFPSDFELPPINWGASLVPRRRLSTGDAPVRVDVFADASWNEMPQIFLEKGGRYRFAIAQGPDHWPGFNAAALVGAVDRTEHFAIGNGCEYVPSRDGEFGCFITGSPVMQPGDPGRAEILIERIA